MCSQYGGALPRHLGKHKEMLQDYKTGAESKGAMTSDDCVSTSAPSLEGSVTAALAVMNQSS